MTVHFLKALDTIRAKLLALATITEEQLDAAILSLDSKDMVTAKRVIADDNKVDELEVDLEEECLKTLALYQPVAEDLRFIITTLKVNNDLERIGDLATNIAARAIRLADCPPPDADSMCISAMADAAKKMLSDAIGAFINQSSTLAREVIIADREINREHAENFRRVETLATENPEHLRNYINLLSVSRYLERIGDQAKNIAEDVIYWADGKIVRHNPESH